jgi:hypothetical protein
MTWLGHLSLHITCTGVSSVTDNFGNRDNLSRERRSTRKSEGSLILWGRRGTQAVTITSVTEVIEVIGYHLWPYLAGRLGTYRSFNPENWIRRHIREAYQDDEPTLEISGIPVCQNDGIRSSTASYPTFPAPACGTCGVST